MPSAEWEKGTHFLQQQQRKEGCVVGEDAFGCLVTTQYVIVAFLTNQQLPLPKQSQLTVFFRSCQNRDGGWGIHPDSHSYVFITTLVYIALRLLGLSSADPLCLKALSWLKKQGKTEAIPSLGKFWLALLNLYGWEGINPILPEIWLLPTWFPIHPRRFYFFTRELYLSISYLYGVRFQTPVTPIIEALRQELYTMPYESIRFSEYRNVLSPNDVSASPHPILKIGYSLLHFIEKHLPLSVRKKALAEILDRIHYHQDHSHLVGCTPMNGLQNSLVFYHNREMEAFHASFKGIDYWSWEDESEGLRYSAAHSHTWDTAFTTQALLANSTVKEFSSPFFQGVAHYFKQAQLVQELPRYAYYYRDTSVGGFCFSDATPGWPVSDCTAEALTALLLLKEHLPQIVLPETDRMVAAVHFILSRQNKTGGWGSFERQRGGLFLERLNPTELLSDCMVDHSFVECTASCMQALHLFCTAFPNLLDASEYLLISRSIRRGEIFLRRQQEKQGSWRASYGIASLFGTLFGIIGLLAAGAKHDDPAITRGCDWLLQVQLPDGGWGESWQSTVKGCYVPHQQSQVIMTSWALMALLLARYQKPDAQQAIEKGIALLKQRQLPNGDWPQEGVAASFATVVLAHYRLYKNYFPLWALGLYESSNIQTKIPAKEHDKTSSLI